MQGINIRLTGQTPGASLAENRAVAGMAGRTNRTSAKINGAESTMNNFTVMEGGAMTGGTIPTAKFVCCSSRKDSAYRVMASLTTDLGGEIYIMGVRAAHDITSMVTALTYRVVRYKRRG